MLPRLLLLLPPLLTLHAANYVAIPRIVGITQLSPSNDCRHHATFTVPQLSLSGDSRHNSTVAITRLSLSNDYHHHTTVAITQKYIVKSTFWRSILMRLNGRHLAIVTVTRLSPSKECLHYVTVTITRLSPSHDCRRHTTVAVKRLSLSHDCRHHMTVAITWLSPSRDCRHHSLAITRLSPIVAADRMRARVSLTCDHRLSSLAPRFSAWFAYLL